MKHLLDCAVSQLEIKQLPIKAEDDALHAEEKFSVFRAVSGTYFSMTTDPPLQRNRPMLGRMCF